MTAKIRPASGEKLVAAGTIAMATGAFFGHLLAPNVMADFFKWPRNRWYQREIGAFNAGLGYGVVELLRGRSETAFIRSAALTALLLAATRAAALASGDRSGPRNVGTVIGDLTLGVGAIFLARQARIHRTSPK